VTTPTVPATPLLGHVDSVELVETGSWNAASGPVTFTPDDLASAVAALDCPAVRRPVLKAGHGGQHGIGEPALGYVANLRLSNEGQTLVGDYRGMPGWLTDTSTDSNGAAHSVLSSAYPDRSIEGEFGHRCQLGHEHPFVVTAVALLGVERPAVGTLQSLQELYGVVAATTPSPGGRPVAVRASDRQEQPVPQHISAAATTDDVRRSYYAGPGAGWSWWIREMYVDPPELIVDNDDDASVWRVPYTVDADGAVTFADAQRVRVEYVNARAAAGAAPVRFASRTESRPGQPPAASTTTEPSTAPAAEPAAPSGTTTTPESEGAMPDLTEGVRERLGLAADAGEDTILAALDEALNERAEAPPVAASSTPPAGTVLVEEAVLEQLRVQAAAGAEARAQQQLEQRTRTVDAAIAEGRIAPARRDHWLAQLAADPGAETVLSSLAKGTVPIVELGVPGDSDGAEDEYTAIYGNEKGA
jgi:hypothetical protein